MPWRGACARCGTAASCPWPPCSTASVRERRRAWPSTPTTCSARRDWAAASASPTGSAPATEPGTWASRSPSSGSARESSIGVALNAACFMTPEKSLTFLAGAGGAARVDDYFSQCARCWMAACAYRRGPAHRTVKGRGERRSLPPTPPTAIRVTAGGAFAPSPPHQLLLGDVTRPAPSVSIIHSHARSARPGRGARGRSGTIRPMPVDNVILVGFMGAGKSTVGRVLARRLGRCFVETDDVIAAREGRAIPEIFRAGWRGALSPARRGGAGGARPQSPATSSPPAAGCRAGRGGWLACGSWARSSG